MVPKEIYNPYLIVTQETGVQFRRYNGKSALQGLIELVKPNQHYGIQEHEDRNKLWHANGRKYNERALNTLRSQTKPPFVILLGDEEIKNYSQLLETIRAVAKKRLENNFRAQQPSQLEQSASAQPL